MRTPLVAGNWKMHKTLGDGRALVAELRSGVTDLAGVEVLICPPVQLLFPMAKAVADCPIMLGAQNVHEAESGAFTGEVSAAMMKDTGATHVIVGHSERRQVFGEPNERLAGKVRSVVGCGLTAIYCVGETLEEREAGRTEAVVERQMAEVIGKDVDPTRLVIAYEPVWAIGTGKTATPREAQAVHARIRGILGSTYDQPTADSTRILYGGSVKPANAADLLAQPDIDGALVGGACLVATDFLAIIAAAATVGAASA